MVITDKDIETKFKPKLTPEFLELLAELVEVINHGLDATETAALYREACHIAGVKPRQLDLSY